MTASETPITASLQCDGALDRAFHFLGKRWNGVILANLFDGPASFSTLSRGVSGISDSMLSDRLSELGRAGLVKRTVAEGPPVMVVYELSPSGQALLPALQELAKWAGANLTPEACSQATAKGSPC
ncbi:HxlR family transcriptional regulator [Jatrophihabitans sp. GAS493]|uniref:winged helix-turn-helix transcriptional regulator n=1 Tax=Jatrophihabitans sp. GAS493 TaxID=1907575 RepID=UPI000BB718EB|nr:helix-turn-helix domain-containing protein [Jatrophihabitans sp. GAS493]SOD71399.1 HxlR family transcriptional regulator [Jatrophihabitans sp. GAS493]